MSSQKISGSSEESRRDFLKKVGVGAAALPFVMNASSCATGGKRPNILYIMSDDHAFQAISCYGSKVNNTPNIDRLAAEGVRFEQSFVTNSICAPSRAVLLTGKHSHLNGLIDNAVRFDGSQQTFPKLLQQAGYTTAIFGKWHLKSDPTGFDYWSVLPGQGRYYNPDFKTNGKRVRKTGYATDLITDECLEWLSKQDNQKPFCCMLHHKAPHRNWMPGPKYLSLYKDTEIPEPETLFDDYATRSDAASEQEMTVAHHLYPGYDLKLEPLPEKDTDTKRIKDDRRMYNSFIGRLNEEQKKAWDAAYRPENAAFRKANLKGKDLVKWQYQRYMKDYLRCIASVDENIGRVLDYLKQTGLEENTVVVYTSDQGFYLGEHGWFDKRFMYEESLRMPLIIRYPKEIKPAENDKDLVQNLDFAPTFLDYAGVKIPSDMQGKSMRNVLKGKTPSDWRKSIYYHYYEYPAVHMVKRHYGVRTNRYKLIHFYYDIDAWELYDLEKDPHELNNVYDNPEYAETVKELKAELQRLREYYKDTDNSKYMPKEKIAVTHKVVGKPVKLKYPYSKKYTGGGPNALTDGFTAPRNLPQLPDYTCWQGFEGDDLDAVIDLGEVTDVTRIAAGFMQHIGSWIFMPLSVEFAVSENGRKYSRIQTVKNSIAEDNPKIQKFVFRTDTFSKKARYIRVRAKNRGVCPPWHNGAGGKSWVFADEIIVR